MYMPKITVDTLYHLKQSSKARWSRKNLQYLTKCEPLLKNTLTRAGSISSPKNLFESLVSNDRIEKQQDFNHNKTKYTMDPGI